MWINRLQSQVCFWHVLYQKSLLLYLVSVYGSLGFFDLSCMYIELSTSIAETGNLSSNVVVQCLIDITAGVHNLYTMNGLIPDLHRAAGEVRQSWDEVPGRVQGQSIWWPTRRTKCPVWAPGLREWTHSISWSDIVKGN